MLTIARHPRQKICLARPALMIFSRAAQQRMIDHEHGGLIRADWLNMVFLHLEVDPAALRPHVPFDLDLLEGRAFISLVAFVMRRFRPRGSGPIGSLLCAPVARHGFLNVRTYVMHRDEPGIFFLTEWVSNPLSVMFGPRTYGLPYRWGRLRYEHDMAKGLWRGTVLTPNRAAAFEYRACSRPGPDVSAVEYDYRHNLISDSAMECPEVGRRRKGQSLDESSGQSPDESDYRHNLNSSASAGVCTADEGSLDEFLLERYTAYTRHRGVNRRFRIWHRPWKVVSIDATIDRADLLDCIDPQFQVARLVSAHASVGVRDVWIGGPRRVE